MKDNQREIIVKRNDIHRGILTIVGCLLVMSACVFLGYCIGIKAVPEGTKPAQQDVSQEERQEAAGEEAREGICEQQEENRDAQQTDGAVFIASGTGFDGAQITKEQLQGHKVTVVNIWTTFCGPCIEEMPVLQRLSEEYPAEELQILGVCADLYIGGRFMDKQLTTAKEILLSCGVTYETVIPSEELQMGALSEIQTFPTTYIYDAQGRELRVLTGARDYDGWRALFDEVLIESEAE